MATPHIVAQGLSKSFDQGKTFALKNVSLRIDEGEFICVIGLSGAGKSTFLRCVNGMNIPTSGQLEVLGKQIQGLDAKGLRDLRRQIGFIFQQFNLVKNLSVLQNVLVGRVAFAPFWRAMTGWFSSEDIAKARAALKSVGLEGREMELARNLSGGQQQRVAIARALVQEPSIILADEPMASLDPKLSEVVLKILERVNREQKITVLVNIHVLELARKFAKRIIAFRHGELIYDGPVAGLEEIELERIYQVESVG